MESFVLGGRTFALVRFRDDKKREFLARALGFVYLLNASGTNNGDLSPFDGWFEHLADTLPKLVTMVCQETDASIAEEWVRANSKLEELTSIVHAQLTFEDLWGFALYVLRNWKTPLAIMPQANA